MLVTHLPNIRHARFKLSTQCHTSIGRTLTAFLAFAGGFAACIQGQLADMCWGVRKPGSLSAGGPSPSFGSRFHTEALALTLWLHCSCACACSHASLTLSLAYRLPSPPIWLISMDLLGAPQAVADPCYHLRTWSSPSVAGSRSWLPMGESPALPPGHAPWLLACLPSPSRLSLLPDTWASYRPGFQLWWTFRNPGPNYVIAFEEGLWTWHLN